MRKSDPIEGRCEVEVLSKVINDDRSLEGPPQVMQVLDGKIFMGCRMLAVESVRYAALAVDVVEDPVGVVGHGSGENYNFVEIFKLVQEAKSSRADQVEARLFSFRDGLVDFEVDQSLVQVKDKSVDLVGVTTCPPG
eukprot:CAMPEP_0170504794 /NCGR_PEP_ID=MMETSP0208-20121228/48953_1 /TAXON_ID=197538 /ORGANISM="Strombidium inclinatum, Strain S3" /LENGTH=136 /DNA_ID=CAMNT_0010785239 /DNA_START=150 /DNA_END=561 /DNA_ORIENTATION=+